MDEYTAGALAIAAFAVAAMSRKEGYEKGRADGLQFALNESRDQIGYLRADVASARGLPAPAPPPPPPAKPNALSVIKGAFIPKREDEP